MTPFLAEISLPVAIAIAAIVLLVLVVMGSFFRGPGFNFVAPWDKGLFFEL